ncbi:ABC transporter ATP-binding protein [Nocardia abscessus]|uniref:ABC transporter ATP-binding protein n=1 Tax=Nocardia abscessus TaxID=120957 RepID=UPI002457CBC1|nr:ABC transporter ATP-binding protein [Nocardia abscessus]
MNQLRLWCEAFALCWRKAPTAATVVLVLQVSNAVALPASAYGLKLLVDAASEGEGGRVALAAMVAAAALAAGFYLGEITDVLTIHLVDRIGLSVVEPEIMGMCTRIDGIDHLERSEYLDKVTAVHGQGWAIVESAWSTLGSVLVVVQLGVLLLLLGGTSPWMLLMVIFAVLQLAMDRRGKRRLVAAETDVAENMRLQRRLFEILTDPQAGKEVRVTGAGPELVRRQAEAWRRVVSVRTRARRIAACYSVTGWMLFAAGYTFVLWVLLRQGGSAGDVVLVITAASQLRSVVESGLGRSAQALEASRIIRPFTWLRDYFTAQIRRGADRRDAPGRLRSGIQLDRLGFTYPDATAPAVEDVSAFLPAGSVVAIVGEYGSGKTTLVKLLAKFYEPTDGAIRVDGIDLAEFTAASWWSRMSAAFQDFGRYRTAVDDAVRLGDLAADDSSVAEALVEADAAEFVRRLPDGARTQLGGQFGGVELSEGQWQRIALARACLRTGILLFVLDEPTASLDAPSEHAIFRKYMARSRAFAEQTGAVTIVVSHRFSTVAEADLVLVMERGRLVEQGSHTDLMARGGTYAEFYDIQAAAYATPAAAGPDVDHE